VRGRPWEERAPQFGAGPGAGLRRRRGQRPGGARAGARAVGARAAGERGALGEWSGTGGGRSGRAGVREPEVRGGSGRRRPAQAGERAQAVRRRQGERRAALARGHAGEVSAEAGSSGPRCGADARGQHTGVARAEAERAGGV
jgi:hypothetical protein